MSNEELEKLPATDPRRKAWEEGKECLRACAENEVAAIRTKIAKNQQQQEAAHDNNN